jgi:hypothetical protein
MKSLFAIILTLLLAACAPAALATPTNIPAPVALSFSAAEATLTPSVPTVTATFTPLPITETPSSTPTQDAGSTICGWQWARQNLPEVSAQFLGALQTAGLPVETARAEAYGENCVGQDGSILRFAVMETDYYITISVTDLADETTLGNLLTQAFAVLDQFPVGQTPGPNPGYIGVTFKAADQTQNLWFQRSRSADLRTQDLSRANLYRALKN